MAGLLRGLDPYAALPLSAINALTYSLHNVTYSVEFEFLIICVERHVDIKFFLNRKDDLNDIKRLDLKFLQTSSAYNFVPRDRRLLGDDLKDSLSTLAIFHSPYGRTF